jgi:hypothetical protein
MSWVGWRQHGEKCLRGQHPVRRGLSALFSGNAIGFGDAAAVSIYANRVDFGCLKKT